MSDHLMSLQTDGTIVKNERTGSVYFLLEIDCPSIASRIKPGQFIMLKVSDNDYPLLRRPFSVHKSYSSRHPEREKRGHLLILYKVIGKGTEKMTALEKAAKADMIGPLVNGFTLPVIPSSSNVILVGGGVGVGSLFPLAETLRGAKLSVFIGAKTGEDILCRADFRKWTSNIFIATEDGSLGFKGTVIDLLLSKKRRFKNRKSQYLYSCGPMGMLEELAKKVRLNSKICQASLEARMACGFGACWGCVVKTKDPRLPYQRVCKEGPVFNLADIIWESSQPLDPGNRRPVLVKSDL